LEGGDDPPLELPGTSRTLFAQQVVRVVDDPDGGKHCQTVSYRYRLQADDSPGSTPRLPGRSGVRLTGRSTRASLIRAVLNPGHPF